MPYRKISFPFIKSCDLAHNQTPAVRYFHLLKDIEASMSLIRRGRISLKSLTTVSSDSHGGHLRPNSQRPFGMIQILSSIRIGVLEVGLKQVFMDLFLSAS
jgi:hypothetical protein